MFLIFVVFLLISTALFSVAYAESEKTDTKGKVTISSLDATSVSNDKKVFTPNDVVIAAETDIDLYPLGNYMCDADWTITCTTGLWITYANVQISWNDGPIQNDKITQGRLPSAYGSVQRIFSSAKTVTATLTGTCVFDFQYSGVMTPVSESTYVFK